MPLPIISPTRKKLAGIYSDFHKDLVINPTTKDLALRKDEEAVKESLRNLLLTDRGERLFQPDIGSDIRATLFEQNTPAALTILKQQVIETINNYEPRVTIIDVEVLSDYDDNRVIVKIHFYVRNREVPVLLNIFLERIR